MHLSTVGTLGLLALALAACGGGGGDSGAPPATRTPAPSTVEQTSYYPGTTAILSRGPVLLDAQGVPTATPHGLWTFHHPPADGNGVAWIKTYVNGTWDQSAPWTEFNPDGSIRDDREDRR